MPIEYWGEVNYDYADLELQNDKLTFEIKRIYGDICSLAKKYRIEFTSADRYLYNNKVILKYSHHNNGYDCSRGCGYATLYKKVRYNNIVHIITEAEFKAKIEKQQQYTKDKTALKQIKRSQYYEKQKILEQEKIEKEKLYQEKLQKEKEKERMKCIQTFLEQFESQLGDDLTCQIKQKLNLFI